MNMLSQMAKLPNIYVIIFCLFVSIYGRGEDLFPSCEIELMVRRGTTVKRVPQQSVTVRCPVKHCGKSLNITWCKLGTNNWERINTTQNVQITQDDVRNEMISYLTFKWISVYDDGLYRCELKGDKYLYSHAINISVSDMHQGADTADNTQISTVVPLSAARGEALSWLPYLYICVGIALLVVTMILLTLLRFNGHKSFTETLTFQPTKRQEMSSHMIPDLPKGSAPSTPVLQAHFALNEIYSPSTAGTPPLPLSLITDRNLPLANTGDESQGSDSAVYAVINHTQCGTTARKQCAASRQDKSPEYATVNVS